MIQLGYCELYLEYGNHKDSSNVQEFGQDFVQEFIIERFWQSVF